MIQDSRERAELIALLRAIHSGTATPQQVSQLPGLAESALQTAGQVEDLKIAICAAERCKTASADWPELSSKWDELDREITTTEDALGSAGSSIEKAPIEQKYNALLRERLNQRSEYARVRALTLQLEGLRADGIA